MHKMAASTTGAAAAAALDGPLSAPKYGTLVPNRIFVGGISGDTTESDLCRVFSAYGNVKSTKIIVDRAGVSKGYGFVTFETEQEAQRLQADGECVVLRDRKLNIAPAIKKQSLLTTNGAVYYTTAPPGPISNMPIDQFTAAVYQPVNDFTAAAAMPTMYPPSMQYQPFYQYYSVPMNVPALWPQNYQGCFPSINQPRVDMPPLNPLTMLSEIQAADAAVLNRLRYNVDEEQNRLLKQSENIRQIMRNYN